MAVGLSRIGGVVWVFGAVVTVAGDSGRWGWMFLVVWSAVSWRWDCPLGCFGAGPVWAGTVRPGAAGGRLLGNKDCYLVVLTI